LEFQTTAALGKNLHCERKLSNPSRRNQGSVDCFACARNDGEACETYLRDPAMAFARVVQIASPK
ncbi:MAG: hypothetical protein P4M15_14190, partial [Alphaproteobacteria bacterium]|nr:hypothetical protein [Alphaproteobacteria bacterium]